MSEDVKNYGSVHGVTLALSGVQTGSYFKPQLNSIDRSRDLKKMATSLSSSNRGVELTFPYCTIDVRLLLRKAGSHLDLHDNSVPCGIPGFSPLYVYDWTRTGEFKPITHSFLMERAPNWPGTFLYCSDIMDHLVWGEGYRIARTPCASCEEFDFVTFTTFHPRTSGPLYATKFVGSLGCRRNGVLI